MLTEAELLCMVCKHSGPEPIGVTHMPQHVTIVFQCEACHAIWEIHIDRDDVEDETMIDLVVMHPGKTA